MTSESKRDIESEFHDAIDQAWRSSYLRRGTITRIMSSMVSNGQEITEVSLRKEVSEREKWIDYLIETTIKRHLLKVEHFGLLRTIAEDLLQKSPLSVDRIHEAYLKHREESVEHLRKRRGSVLTDIARKPGKTQVTQEQLEPMLIGAITETVLDRVLDRIFARIEQAKKETRSKEAENVREFLERTAADTAPTPTTRERDPDALVPSDPAPAQAPIEVDMGTRCAKCDHTLAEHFSREELAKVPWVDVLKAGACRRLRSTGIECACMCLGFQMPHPAAEGYKALKLYRDGEEVPMDDITEEGIRRWLFGYPRGLIGNSGLSFQSNPIHNPVVREYLNAPILPKDPDIVPVKVKDEYGIPCANCGHGSFSHTSSLAENSAPCLTTRNGEPCACPSYMPAETPLGVPSTAECPYELRETPCLKDGGHLPCVEFDDDEGDMIEVPAEVVEAWALEFEHKGIVLEPVDRYMPSSYLEKIDLDHDERIRRLAEVTQAAAEPARCECGHPKTRHRILNGRPAGCEETACLCIRYKAKEDKSDG